MSIVSLLRTFLSICPFSIKGNNEIEVLEKYLYCKKWNILPYESYEKTPKWWISSERIIEDEINLLSKIKKPRGARPDGTPKRSRYSDQGT